jgi:hypothetical protein
MEFKAIGMTHKDAEFLESRKFSVNEIARWFGVPPHLISDVERSTSWGTGIEEQNLAFLIYSLLPDITLWEQAMRHTLILQPERFFAQFNVNALLRADTKTRYEVYQLAITNGILSPNECRELEERNPREGGDDYLTPMNMRKGEDAMAMSDGATKAAIAIAHRLVEELDSPRQHEAGPPPAATAASATIDRAIVRAAALARWCAGQVVEREAEELRTIAARSKSAERWKHAVASFYGRHAAMVAQAMSVSVDRARTYCHDQERGLAGGVPVDDEAWRNASEDALVARSRGE